MIQKLLRGVLIAVLAFGLVACEKRPQTAQVAFKAAPSFELKDAAGKVHSLEELRGNVVIVHFWASWCPPCIEEIPRWIAAAPSFKNMPVKLVAVSVDEDWAKALSIFPADKVPPNMLLLLDPVSEVARKYGTHQFPESYLLNKDLQVVAKWIGSQDWSSSMVRFNVAKAMAPSAPAAPNVKN